MMRRYWYPILVLLLAACQPAPPVTASPAIAATGVAPAGKSAGPTSPPATPSALPNASVQPAVNSSSSDPNAPNLIVVRNQPIANNGVTIDAVTAAQAGWVVIYLQKKGQPGHEIGFVAVPAGRSQNLVVTFNPGPGVDVSPVKLKYEQLFVILQAGSTAPGTPVQVQNRSVVAIFTVLPGEKP